MEDDDYKNEEKLTDRVFLGIMMFIIVSVFMPFIALPVWVIVIAWKMTQGD